MGSCASVEKSKLRRISTFNKDSFYFSTEDVDGVISPGIAKGSVREFSIKNSDDGYEKTERPFILNIKRKILVLKTFFVHGINSDPDQFTKKLKFGFPITKNKKSSIILWIDDAIQNSILSFLALSYECLGKSNQIISYILETNKIRLASFQKKKLQENGPKFSISSSVLHKASDISVPEQNAEKHGKALSLNSFPDIPRLVEQLEPKLSSSIDPANTPVLVFNSSDSDPGSIIIGETFYDGEIGLPDSPTRSFAPEIPPSVAKSDLNEPGNKKNVNQSKSTLLSGDDNCDRSVASTVSEGRPLYFENFYADYSIPVILAPGSNPTPSDREFLNQQFDVRNTFCTDLSGVINFEIIQLVLNSFCSRASLSFARKSNNQSAISMVSDSSNNKGNESLVKPIREIKNCRNELVSFNCITDNLTFAGGNDNKCNYQNSNKNNGNGKNIIINNNNNGSWCASSDSSDYGGKNINKNNNNKNNNNYNNFNSNISNNSLSAKENSTGLTDGKESLDNSLPNLRINNFQMRDDLGGSCNLSNTVIFSKSIMSEVVSYCRKYKNFGKQDLLSSKGSERSCKSFISLSSHASPITENLNILDSSFSIDSKFCNFASKIVTNEDILAVYETVDIYANGTDSENVSMMNFQISTNLSINNDSSYQESIDSVFLKSRENPSGLNANKKGLPLSSNNKGKISVFSESSNHRIDGDILMDKSSNSEQKFIIPPEDELTAKEDDNFNLTNPSVFLSANTSKSKNGSPRFTRTHSNLKVPEKWQIIRKDKIARSRKDSSQRLILTHTALKIHNKQLGILKQQLRKEEEAFDDSVICSHATLRNLIFGAFPYSTNFVRPWAKKFNEDCSSSKDCITGHLYGK